MSNVWNKRVIRPKARPTEEMVVLSTAEALKRAITLAKDVGESTQAFFNKAATVSGAAGGAIASGAPTDDK